jgi:hypothetical protein
MFFSLRKKFRKKFRNLCAFLFFYIDNKNKNKKSISIKKIIIVLKNHFLRHTKFHIFHFLHNYGTQNLIFGLFLHTTAHKNSVNLCAKGTFLHILCYGIL